MLLQLTSEAPITISHLQRWSEGVRYWIETWRASAHLDRELSPLSAAERAALMQDIGLDQRHAAELVPVHAGAGRLLLERLAAMDIDAGYLRSAEPALYRDMQRTCGRCRGWRHCARDLARGDPETGQRSYCLNAATIDALLTWEREPRR